MFYGYHEEKKSKKSWEVHKKRKISQSEKASKELLDEKKDAELLLFLEEREQNILQLDDEDMYLSQMEVMSMALELDIDKDMFLQWREARYGSTTIEKTNNLVWEWLIRTRASGYISRLVWGLEISLLNLLGGLFLDLDRAKPSSPMADWYTSVASMRTIMTPIFSSTMM